MKSLSSAFSTEFENAENDWSVVKAAKERAEAKEKAEKEEAEKEQVEKEQAEKEEAKKEKGKGKRLLSET